MIFPEVSALLLAAALAASETSASFAPSSGLCRRGAVGFRDPGAAFISGRGGVKPAALASALRAKKPEKDVEEDDDKRKGMKDAFAALDALGSLEDDDDEAASGAKDEVGMIDFEGTPEEEAKLMKDMMSELETEGEEGMYSAVLGEMGGSTKDEGKAKGGVLDDADGIGGSSDGDDDGTLLTYKPASGTGFGAGAGKSAAIGEPDMEEFMAKAIQEAVDEARTQTPDEIAAAGPASSDSIYDDEEMMKEISDLFDDANKKLVESIKEIQVEQAALAKKSAQERQDAVKETEERLAEAEAGVARLMGNVAKETAEVERALADLEAAKEQMDADPMTKMADLKGGGIVKQGAFVGLVLFSIRALAEVAQMAGPGGEAHSTAAAIQGVIAAACAAYLALG